MDSVKKRWEYLGKIVIIFFAFLQLALLEVKAADENSCYVANEQELNAAIANEQISHVYLTESFDLTSEKQIARSFQIDAAPEKKVMLTQQFNVVNQAGNCNMFTILDGDFILGRDVTLNGNQFADYIIEGSSGSIECYGIVEQSKSMGGNGIGTKPGVDVKIYSGACFKNLYRAVACGGTLYAQGATFLSISFGAIDMSATAGGKANDCTVIECNFLNVDNFGVHHGEENQAHTARVSKCIFDGGSQTAVMGSGPGTIYIENCEMRNLKGAGVYQGEDTAGKASVYVSNCIMKNCDAQNEYQGSFCYIEGKLTLKDNDIGNVSSDKSCAGIYVEGELDYQSGIVHDIQYRREAAAIWCKGKLTVSGGEIYQNVCQYGTILVDGNFLMEGGNIYQNQVVQTGGAIELCDGTFATIQQGRIQRNQAGQYGGAIYNRGNLYIENVEIMDNGNYAIYNENQIQIVPKDEVKILENMDGAIYQNGMLKIEGNAKINTEIFLPKERFVIVTQKLTSENPLIYELSEDDITEGRVLANYIYEESEDLKQHSLETLTEEIAQQQWIGISEKKNKVGEYPYQILLGKVKMGVRYHSNYQSQQEKIFTDIVSREQSYVIKDVVDKEMKENVVAVFLGWDRNRQAIIPEYQNKEMPIEIKKAQELFLGNTESVFVDFYAIWDYAPSIEREKVLTFYEGEKITKELLMKDIIVKDKEDDRDKKEIKAWISSIAYKDEAYGFSKEYSPEMTDEIFEITFEQMGKKKEDHNQTLEVAYHAVDCVGNETKKILLIEICYNNPPEIEAEDKKFLLNEVKDGRITEEMLLEDVKVSDVEDDKEEDTKKELRENLKVKEFHKESFNVAGEVEVIYQVVDSMGKEAQKTVKVTILDGDQLSEDAVEGEVRFITKTYAEAEEEKGGLHLASFWKTQESYQQLLNQTFQNEKNSSGSWNQSVQVWQFSAEQVEEVKAYIQEYGIGNSENENALKTFLQRFKD